MEKYFTTKLITAFSFIVGIVGLINDVFYTTHSFYVMRYKRFVNPLELDWIFGGHSLQFNGHNYVNAVFDALLLLGGILYILTKNREVRLIRFVVSIIFLVNILCLASGIISFFIYIKLILSQGINYFFMTVVYYVVYLFWIYTSYNILKYFNQNRKLQEDTVTENEITSTYFVKALIGKRFIHPFIDTFVAIVLFSPYLEIFTQGNSFFSLHNFYPEDHLFLVVVVPRIIYYLLFETILGVTPAKLLTQTRVIDYNGDKPSLKNILIRTVSRLVPFEAFSFFTDSGWHDKWSETIVANEVTKKNAQEQ